MRANEIRAALSAGCALADEYLISNQIVGHFNRHTFEFSNTPERGVTYGGVMSGVKTRFKGLYFELSDVDERYGFGDGDFLDPVYYNWLEARGWRVNVGEDNIGYPYVHSHKLLWAIWERLLLPESGLREGEVYMMDTVHNPLRFDGAAYTGRKGVVKVGVDAIIKLADEIFPARSGAWLNLYNQLTPKLVRGAFGDAAASYFADIFEGPLARVSSEVEEVFLGLLQNGFDVEAVSFTQVLEMVVGAVRELDSLVLAKAT